MRLIPLVAVGCLLANGVLAESTEDRKLAAFFKDHLDEHFRQQPLAATRLGDHRFDALLDDLSPEARAGWLELAHRTLHELPRRVDYRRLSRDGQIDFEIFRQDLKRRVWLANHTRPFEEDPRIYGDYLNDSVYLLLTQSTLPRETNISNAIARMAGMPRIIAEAQRSLTRPAKPVLETAIRQNAGTIKFYESDLLNCAGETPQQDQLKDAAAILVTRLKDYQKFLEGPARSRAQDNWRLGKARFARKFELETDAGVTADQNLADAQAEFARVRTEIYGRRPPALVEPLSQGGVASG